MCYKPIRILNPTHNFQLRDRLFLDVPCGKCYECRKRKVNEWFVRSYYTMLETTELYHGNVFYVTLTYDNGTLPMYNGIPVFSKRHVQLYLKRVRKALFLRFSRAVSLKYIICSEYGGKTHRPHYHGLIFVNTPLSLVDRYTVKSILRSSWQSYHGFVSFGRKLDGVKEIGVVQSTHALSYVGKYICKDVNFNYDLPKEFHPLL